MSKSQQNPIKPQPPFHKLTPKQPGQRVKIPRFATDESRGYVHGTVLPSGSVEWDEYIPYLGKVTSASSAMSL